MKKSQKNSIIISLSLVLVVAVFVIFGIFFAHDFSDFLKAQNFKPSEKILQITSRIKLTHRAKTIFYATNPQVLASDDFNSSCSKLVEKSTILGCYNDDKISIFDVENSELDGVEEVTAAHELLHAVWNRTSKAEREKLSKKIEENYEKVKTPELEKTMAAYAETEPGERVNELHSILGTEFAGLSEELESYYSNFFENRGEIVSMNARYKSKFEDLENRAKSLDKELKALNAEIKQETSDYSAKIKSLNSAIDLFNTRAQNGYYYSQNAFNADRAQLVARGNLMEQYREQINSKVANYNSKVTELQYISGQIQRLYDSLNSKLERVDSAKPL